MTVLCRLGSFYGPTGVAILNGDLIVADADNYRFQVGSLHPNGLDVAT